MRPLRVGKFRQRVQLYDIPETVQDSYGQTSLSGNQIVGPGLNGTFAAEVRPLKGDEQLNVRQIWPTATHIVNMRWLGSAIPPSFNGTASFTNGSPIIGGFAASYQGIGLAPYVGAAITGINTNAVPANTTVVSLSPLTMSANATLNANGASISIGTEVNNPFGEILPRMYLIDMLDGSQLNVLYAQNIEKRNRAWQLTCAEKVNL